jgi:hypothetical protein
LELGGDIAMAWFSRLTRFGDMHWVFGQEKEISCGVACVIMAAYKINKLRPGVKSSFSEAEILALAKKHFGPNPLGTDGLSISKISTLLNDPALKMTGWKYARIPRQTVPDKLVKTIGTTGGIGPIVNVTPMIVMVDWKGGGGSHFVLVDTVRSFLGSLYATFCDPWDANVHVVKIEKSKEVKYAGKPAVKFDFGGTHYEYYTPSVGSVFDGDVFWRL